MSATTPIRDQDTRAPAPAMKWWGWGEQSIEFTHEDKPGLAPFIREALGCPMTQASELYARVLGGESTVEWGGATLDVASRPRPDKPTESKNGLVAMVRPRR